MPAFDGLFVIENTDKRKKTVISTDDRHEVVVQNLLFELLTWHGLAKLRRHTTLTIAELDASTIRLGASLRGFVKMSKDDFDTRELPRERESRLKGQADDDMEGESEPQKRTMSLSTPKIHDLGHAVSVIRKYGPLDGLSTMVVGLGPHVVMISSGHGS
jgi:hypothetical protein